MSWAATGHVRAAGGAVWRPSGPDGAGPPEVLVVHRPKYDDWTLPKGKAAPGESDEDCARREVQEETGLRCVLGAHLADVSYVDRWGRPKVARYWAMRPAGGSFVPNAEVDEVRWLPVAEALDLLSYDRDRPVVRALAGGPLPVDFLARPAGGPPEPVLVHPDAGDAAALRRRVLYAHLPDATGSYPQDDRPGAVHLGLADPPGVLVAVASWYPEATEARPAAAPYRLRGMAVDPPRQGRGLGRVLFRAGLDELGRRRADLLWANARDPVIGFYERLGMSVVGPGFLAAGGIPHHVVVLDLTEPGAHPPPAG